MHVSDKNFNNIKIHTQYSICEGAIKIDDLAEYCKSNKIRSIGLADSYNLCGALEFSEKLSKIGSVLLEFSTPPIPCNCLSSL